MPVFLKELVKFACFSSLSSLENILLIDKHPFKNLMNNPHNDVFPPPFFGDLDDNYLKLHLVPWLDGHFKSNEVVPDYMKNNLLFHSQSSVAPLSKEGYLILLATLKG